MAKKENQSPKKTDPKSKNKKLRTIVDELRSKGTQGIYIGEEIMQAFDRRIPSDIFGLNVITRMGLPFNAITEIQGPPATFKTTIALGIAKETQKLYGENCAILWLSTENGIDVNWARHIGVKIPYSKDELEDYARMGISEEDMKPLIEEQSSCGDFIILIADSVEESLDIAKRMLETGELNLYVFDSVGAVSAEGEYDGSHGDAQVAINTRLISKHVRFLHSIGNQLTNRGAETGLLLINQVRVKIGGFSPNPSVTPMDNPSGFGLKHGKVLSIETKMVGTIRHKDRVWAKRVALRVTKSKVCVPHRSCTITYVIRSDNPFNLPVGPDSAAEAFELANECGVIKYDGSKWVFGTGVLEYEGRKAKKEEIPALLQEDPDLLKMVQDEVMFYHRSLEING